MSDIDLFLRILIFAGAIRIVRGICDMVDREMKISRDIKQYEQDKERWKDEKHHRSFS